MSYARVKKMFFLFSVTQTTEKNKHLDSQRLNVLCLPPTTSVDLVLRIIDA